MKLKLVGMLAIALVLVACSGPEKAARDAIAASKGALKTAQAQYDASCTTDATQTPCVTIHKAVAAQNAAVDALELYCTGSAGTAGAPDFQHGGVCHADKTVQPKLDAAVASLNQIIGDVKSLIGAKP